MSRLKRLILWCCAALMLSTACSISEETTAASGDGAAAPTEPAAPNGTATPTTEPSTSEPSLEPVSKESDSYFYLPQLPDYWLTNPYDTSTPLGQLCWALVEFVRIEFIESFGTIAASPAAVIVDSSIKVPTQDTDTYLDALGAIQEPRIVRVVDDPGLSEELQVFAKGLFEMIAAVEEQARIVGYRNIDHSQLPYKDIESLPNLDIFYKAVAENPTQCPSPDQDTEQIMEDWRDQLNEVNNISD